MKYLLLIVAFFTGSVAASVSRRAVSVMSVPRSSSSHRRSRSVTVPPPSATTPGGSSSSAASASRSVRRNPASPRAFVLRSGKDTGDGMGTRDGDTIKAIPVHVEYEDSEVVVVANDGAVYPGEPIVLEGAYALALALRDEGASAGGHGHGHPHPH